MTDLCKPLEDAVLRVLPGRDQHPTFYDEFYSGLDLIAREAARFACKRLRNKGLAKFRRGLFNEDGEVAGAGYAITEAGLAALQDG